MEEPNPFYEAHKNTTLYVAWPAVTLILSFLPLNYFGNISIIVATFTNSNLRNTANILIAITGVGDMIHVTAQFYLGYLLYSGTNFVNLIDCLHAQTIPVAGACNSSMMVLLIGIDRLFSICMPRVYRNLNSTMYIAALFLISCWFPTYILWTAYNYAPSHPNIKVICIIVEALHGPAYQKWSSISLIIYIITILCYAFVWIIVKVKVSEASRSTVMSRLFKSLTIIMALFMCSWVVVCSSMAITATFWPDSPDLLFFVPLYTGATVNFAAAANYLILYNFSVDYRKAFQKQLTSATALSSRLQHTVVNTNSMANSEAQSKRQIGLSKTAPTTGSAQQ